MKHNATPKISTHKNLISLVETIVIVNNKSTIGSLDYKCIPMTN
jgi:hypothetical protein